MTTPDKRRVSTARRISRADRASFLGHLAAGGTVREAAKASGRHHSSFYELRRSDAAFAEAWDTAWTEGGEALEGEAIKRAMEGFWIETYNGAGELVRREHRHDNTLLAFVLKGRLPERYRDGAQLDVGGTVEFRIISAFEPEEIEGEARELTEGDA